MVHEYRSELTKILNSLGLFWNVRITHHFVERAIERNINMVDMARLCRHALLNYNINMICSKKWFIDYKTSFRVAGVFENHEYVFTTVFKRDRVSGDNKSFQITLG